MAGRRLSRGMSHQHLVEEVKVSARASAARAARASSQRARGMVSDEAMQVPYETMQQDIVGCSARASARALAARAARASSTRVRVWESEETILESGPGPGEGNSEAAEGSDDMDPDESTGEAPVKRRRLGDGVDTVTLISNQVHVKLPNMARFQTFHGRPVLQSLAMPTMDQIQACLPAGSKAFIITTKEVQMEAADPLDNDDTALAANIVENFNAIGFLRVWGSPASPSDAVICGFCPSCVWRR